MQNKLLHYTPTIILLAFFFGLTWIVASCKSDREPKNSASKKNNNLPTKDDVVYETQTPEREAKVSKSLNKTEDIPEGWSEITKSDGIVVDIKYAEDDNFTKKKIYDCGRCFLRPEATLAIMEIHNELKSTLGYGLKVFDCFRPQPFQQRLWDAVPDPDYVTPPAKGSMHSRGLAVDLTIVDQNGDELDMGTPFDFFGKEAHQDYMGHSAEINKNRELLKSAMEKYGFKSIRTEWWHYSYRSKSYPLDPWVWSCQ